MIHNVRDPGEIIRLVNNRGLHIKDGDIINVTMPDESVVTFVTVKPSRIEWYQCAKCDGRSYAGIFDKSCLADRIGFVCDGHCFKLVDNILEGL